MKKKNNNWFKYVVLVAVLLIPFMYSFFYLKAYWNPYGKGNIDNLPVAVVNNDKGDKGDELIDSIKDSKKLKLSVISSSKANEGLNNGKYYAIINIPESFTEDMESASSTNKHHATITYSPNQKSNYLSSQIINTVVLTVEKNLDNAVNSKIVENLSDTVESVPSQLDTISSGFGKLEEGTNKLADGSNTLNSGTKELANGTSQIKSTLSSSINSLSRELTDKEKQQILATIASSKDLSDENIANAALTGLQSNQQYMALKTKYDNGMSQYNFGVAKYKAGIEKYNANLTDYNAGVEKYNATLALYNLTDETVTACINNSSEQCTTIKQIVDSKVALNTSKAALDQAKDTLDNLKTTLDQSKTNLDTLKTVIDSLEETAKQTAIATAKKVSQQVAISTASSVKENATLTTKQSLNTLLSYIDKIDSGATKLSDGSTTLNNGLTTLNNSVKSSKQELDSKISSTKKDVKKVETLADYSKEPIKAETKEVNKVASYGTAFAPLFISIALWVGSLMLFIVLFFDKEQRFGLLGIDSKKHVKRCLAYHGLATVSGIVLGVLLQLLLDFDITNVFLYYISIILVSNCFLAIIEFLIENFGDIGKFIALIILVLQLGASGGTFPIETVTKGFRFLNPMLPMTYTIKLLKEPLISIESSLLTKNFIIVFTIFIVFFGINLGLNIYKEKHQK
ncbi:MAG: YhgE/Pip domain-containing protein [bacterium]|nr:YhgE/Pip domain-containing protein [bacterium]